jgi:catechol 2,3-dioxygenase-like lactoylglutathione lyase family enzyme
MAQMEQPMSEPMTQTDQTSQGTLSITQIDHAIVSVRDLNASESFYTSLLGWKKIDETNNNRLGLFGGLGLNLVQSKTAAQNSSVLGFKTADIDGAANALKEAKVEFTESEFPLPDGTVNRVLTFADPDGNTINLVQKKV